MQKIKYILWILLVGALLLPAVHLVFPLPDQPGLAGVDDQSPAPTFRTFTWTTWFREGFQEGFEKKLNDHTGFRNFTVRLRNQVDFSLFGLFHGPRYSVGKNGYLFENDYIAEYLGKNFIGRKVIAEKCRRLKYVQDTLKKMNIDLVVIIEPGKASFFPDCIPRQFKPWKKDTSNLDVFLDEFKSQNVRYIDLNSYFLLMKDTARFPLIPKNGIHWSSYGVGLVTDTLIRFIEKTRNIRLPAFSWERLELSSDPRDYDNDLGELTNILFKVPGEPLAYPEFVFREVPGCSRPFVLVVGDSFFRNLYDKGIPKNLFSNQEYWFNNDWIYPRIFVNVDPVDHSKLKESVEKQDLVFIMVTEKFMHMAFWRFVDQLYQLYCPGYRQDKIYDYAEMIRTDDGWFKTVMKKAKEQGRSVEEMVQGDATYMFLTEVEKNPDPPLDELVRYFEIKIRDDKTWLAKVAEKAVAQHKTLDQAVHDDAVWMSEQRKMPK